MDVLITELFRFSTPAAPDSVWRTLTSAERSARYFHGFRLESAWRPGATVTATSRAGSLVGEVLAVEAPRRLSFTLAADDDQPETFVTWEVHHAADDGGSIVRLYVDEPAGGDHDDTESTWLPVISALQSVLVDGERKSTPTSR
ncbi:MAG TPA: SRPBCC domain-containing protein [Acidimicrobiales bacterium]